MLRADHNLLLRLILAVAFAVLAPLPAALEACGPSAESASDAVELMNCEMLPPSGSIRVIRNHGRSTALHTTHVTRAAGQPVSPRSEHAERNGIGTALRL